MRLFISMFVDALDISFLWILISFLGMTIFVLYVFLFISSIFLSFKFKRYLSYAIKNKIQDIRIPVLFGFHIILLYPVFLFIILFVICLALYVFFLFYIQFEQGVNVLPVLLVWAIFVFCLMEMGWSYSYNLTHNRLRKIIGISVSKKDQPLLWKMSEQVCKDIGTDMVHEIYVSPLSGIYVTVKGGIIAALFGFSKKILVIGLPSVFNFTVSELKSVIAHEFEHFNNKDLSWSSAIFTLQKTLQNSINALEISWSHNKALALLNLINPLLLVLYLYKLLFIMVTQEFSRVREILADRKAVELYDDKPFIEALKKVARNDTIFYSMVLPEYEKLLKRSKTHVTNIVFLVEEIYASLKPSQIHNLDAHLILRQKKSFSDSHPLLRDRIIYASHFDIHPTYKVTNTSCKIVFKQWKELTYTVSKHLHSLIVHSS